MIALNDDLLKAYQANDQFAAIMNLRGEVYRQQKNRRTIRFKTASKSYFAKIHSGIGWKEIIKNLMQLRLPIMSASNEWQAIQHLEKLGIPTMRIAGFGCRGKNPAKLESFIVTEELLHTESLEDFCKNWILSPPASSVKRALINKVAAIARTMHDSGMNHRDFYLCHFLLELSQPLATPTQATPLHLIDLHRARLWRKLPERWRIKDLSGLYFSSLNIGLTKRDLLRFVIAYSNCSLRKVNVEFWNKVVTRAIKLYTKQLFNTKQRCSLIENCDAVEVKNFKQRIIFDLQYLNDDFIKLLHDPEQIFLNADTHVLKNGDTTTVASFSLHAKKYVIKRYNILHLWHALKRSFRKTRARRCWLTAKRLRQRNVAVANPVAVIENRFGFLRSTAYYICEYIPGMDAVSYFKNSSDDHIKATAQKICAMLRELWKNFFCHGDMKATNIIINNEKPVLIDLDGSKHFTSKNWLFKRALQKDHKRFMKNWQDDLKVKKIFEELL